jgi:hypothetical protein
VLRCGAWSVSEAGATVTVYSGRGTTSATRRYWGRSYGAIWNNDGDTAYLRNASGTLPSRGPSHAFAGS